MKQIKTNIRDLAPLLLLTLLVAGSEIPGNGLSNRLNRILSAEAPHLSDKTKETISRTVQKISEEYQLDPILILAIMKVESSFKPSARSGMGAVGLMQIRPIVLKELGLDIPAHGRTADLLKDPELNIRVGVHYFSRLVERFQGNIWKALMAYNQGPTRVARLNLKSVPAKGYQSKVLFAYRSLRDNS